jgi:hypothetical protein
MPGYLTPLITLAGGFVLGWFGHKLSGIRDRQDRKREFIAFMEQWRHEVDTCGMLDKLASDFNSKVHDFIRETAVIKPDLRGSARQRFDELIDQVRYRGARITEMNEQRDQLIGRALLIQEFNNVIRLIDKN